jgi:hypothetical protein
MELKITYLLFSIIVLLSKNNPIDSSSVIDKPQLLTKEITYYAEDSILLKFTNVLSTPLSLYMSNSYGSTLIKPTIKRPFSNFKVPEFMSSKVGIISWTLIHNSKSLLKGTFTIHPKQVLKSLESYIGPPSIEAGGKDYSMIVVIPTDNYDNPLQDSTKVYINHQFLETQQQTQILTKNRIGYKNIYSPKKTGRILVSSESLGLSSKEYAINTMPAIPTDFNILSSRNHKYADGNQITTFSTSIIKDVYGNIVSDGTYVEFFITNNSNAILKTAGTTIAGIASSKMIHPDQKDRWIVKAYIEGMAESNRIELAYASVISNFEVAFSNENRQIRIGPLKSFMGQLTPDGLEITLIIYENSKEFKTIIKDSNEGFVLFKLNPNEFPKNNYSVIISAAGIEQSFNRIQL